MPAQVFGSGATATQLYLAFNGVAPSNAIYTNWKGVIDTSGESALALQLGQATANMSSAQLAATVLANLGVSAATTNADAFAALSTAVVQLFDAYPAASRGQIVLNMTKLLTGLEGNATYGTAAANFNTTTMNAYTYAADPNSSVPATPTAPTGSFTLTTGADYADATSSYRNGGLLESNFVFTSANQTVTAGAGTLGNTDALVDASTADADVLNATLTSGAVSTTTIQNIETINLSVSVANSGLDFGSVMGAKNVTVTGTANATLSGVNSNSAPEIALNNYNKVLSLSTATLAGTAAAGTADALTVSLSGVAAGGTATAPIIPGLILDTAVAGALETLNLVSAGTTKNTLALSLDGAGVVPTGITKTVVTGAADLDLRVAHSLVSGQTLDASGHTAALNLVVDRQGAGTAATNLTNVTGVDVYTFRDSTAGGDILVASGLGNASTVVVTEGFTGANSLSVKGSAAGAADSLTVKLDHVTDATNVAIGTGLTIADVETVNFVSEGGTSTGNSIAALAVATGSKVTVDGATKLDLQLAAASLVTTVEVKGSGAHKVDFDGAATYASGKNLTIDGSAATGKLTLDGSDFQGTAGGVVESITIRGGSTEDTITGTSNGDAKNVIDAGAGVDTVNVSTANNSNITLGAGADKANLTGVTGAGVATFTDFALGSGGDVLSVNSAGAMTLGGVGATSVNSQLIIVNAAVADNTAAAALVSGVATAEAAVIVINNATGVAELWYDADGTAGGEVKLATFENITTVGTLTDAVTGFIAANFGTWA